MIQVVADYQTAETDNSRSDDIFSPRTTKDDQEICNRISQTLQASGYQSLASIDISSVAGHVRFQGRVPSYYLKQVAQQSVIGMEDVESIDNDLTVVKPQLSCIEY